MRRSVKLIQRHTLRNDYIYEFHWLSRTDLSQVSYTRNIEKATEPSAVLLIQLLIAHNCNHASPVYTITHHLTEIHSMQTLHCSSTQPPSKLIICYARQFLYSEHNAMTHLTHLHLLIDRQIVELTPIVKPTRLSTLSLSTNLSKYISC